MIFIITHIICCLESTGKNRRINFYILLFMARKSKKTAEAVDAPAPKKSSRSNKVSEDERAEVESALLEIWDGRTSPYIVADAAAQIWTAVQPRKSYEDQPWAQFVGGRV